MLITNAKKAVRHTLDIARSEFQTLVKISWIYVFFGCLLTLSENYYYAYLHENALWNYLNDYWFFAFVFCPAAKAILAAINIVSVYRYLIGSPLGFTKIVIRRELISDAPTLSLPIYFYANWRILVFALAIILWQLSLHVVKDVLPFKFFPVRTDIAPRAVFVAIFLASYSLALSQLALVFPFIAVSKTINLRKLGEHIRKLRGNRLETWVVLAIFSIFYAAIHDILKGATSQRIPFHFYHTELVADLRYAVATVAWFTYLNLMAIFSATIFKKVSKSP